MDLIAIFQKYPDHESCIEHLENVRWGDKPTCPHCGSKYVARKSENDRIGRWNCHRCRNSYNVLSGTIFQQTKQPLQKWFLAIFLLLNVKKSLSSYQLARDLDINQKTAWLMASKIRGQMGKDNVGMLQGIIKYNECYIGGTPRKTHKHTDDNPNKRGRGKKQAVIGAIERGGEIKAGPVKNTTSNTPSTFISASIDRIGSTLMTDGCKSYRTVQSTMSCAVINHQRQYTDGLIYTGTTERFWTLSRRTWYAVITITKLKYTHRYITEVCYKYNNRQHKDTWSNYQSNIV